MSARRYFATRQPADPNYGPLEVTDEVTALRVALAEAIGLALASEHPPTADDVERWQRALGGTA